MIRPRHNLFPRRHAMQSATALAALLMAGCATYPPGPGVMVLPNQSASFEQFQYDDYQCQSYARNALGGESSGTNATKGAMDSAATGAVVGAMAGALLGAASGNAGSGAAIGAGSGLVLGAATGTDAYQTGGAMAQDRYDTAYIQCMYAKGHQVPVSRAAQQYTQQPAPTVPQAPPAGSYPPANTPPPPGYR